MVDSEYEDVVELSTDEEDGGETETEDEPARKTKFPAEREIKARRRMTGGSTFAGGSRRFQGCSQGCRLCRLLMGWRGLRRRGVEPRAAGVARSYPQEGDD
jgi:hypothetical protein